MFGKGFHRGHLYTSWPIHHHPHHHRCLCTKVLREEVRAANVSIDTHGGLVSRDELYRLVQKCTLEKDLLLGRHIHCLMIIANLDLINVLGDHLIRMFSSCESLLEASIAFCKVLHPSVYTWNSIISSNVIFGESQRAFELYDNMQEEGIIPVKVTFLHLLKACADKQMILSGKLIHGQLVRENYESDKFISCAIICMYSKCGNIEEGCKVFNSMALRDIGVYSAMISLCIDHGHVIHIPKLLERMIEEGIYPTSSILASFLKACTSINRIALIHYYMISESLDVELVLGNVLIEMYATFGALEESHRVFLGLSAKNSLSWTSLIIGYAQNCCRNESIALFMMMQEENVMLSKVNLPNAFKTCGNVCDLRLGRLFHDHVIRSVFESDANIACSLVDMYAKGNSIEEARKVFDMIENLNEAIWSVMIGGYALNGNSHSAIELFEKLRGKGVEVNKGIVLGVVRACSNLGLIQSGMWMHDQIARTMFEAEIDIASTLIDMYAKYGRIEEARKIFDGMSRHDVVSFGAMIGGYADCDLGLSGLLLFQQMEQEETIEPDKLAYVCVLRACSCSRLIKEGRLIHHRIIKCGHESDMVIGSTLVDMYAKCGGLDEAHLLFNYLCYPDVVAWGALINGYVQQNLAMISFDLFNKMHQQGIFPSLNIFSSLLKACEIMGSTDRGMVLHAQVVESGYDIDGVIVSSLIDMYSKNGDIHDALRVFTKSPNPDIVAWSAMIAGHLSCEDSFMAIRLFEEMLRERIKPDKVTCLLLLKACSAVGASAQGRLIHMQIIICGFESDIECDSAIVAMYAKCGCFYDAHRILEKLQNPSVVTWGAIIAVHANLGGDESLRNLLEGMDRKGTKPDDVIFLNVLASCSHSGSLEEGKGYFRSMREAYSMMPETKHYNCLVDLLGRSGRLSDAHNLLHCIPKIPDIVGWLSLLSGCKVYYNANLGMECYDAVVSCDQNDASSYVLMSNLRAYGETDLNVEKGIERPPIASKVPL